MTYLNKITFFIALISIYSIKSTAINHFLPKAEPVSAPFSSLLNNNQAAIYQDLITGPFSKYPSWNSNYCALRYEIICATLTDLITNTQYRLATLWDLGAAQGYFSFRLGYDFGVTSIMIENGSGELDSRINGVTLLKELCKINNTLNTFVLATTLTSQKLEQIATTQQTDLVLALNIIHALDNWQHALDSICALGTVIILEIPTTEGDITDIAHHNQLAAMHHAVLKKGAVLLAHIPRFYKNQHSILYLIDNRHQHYFSNAKVSYFSNNRTINTCIDQYSEQNTGLTLANYIRYNGVWPEQKTIWRLLKKAARSSELDDPEKINVM